MSGEQTLFALQAQVYALDKSQKWTPLTTEIIQVSFIYSSATNQTRIYAVEENGTTVVNSIIFPNMQYRRPSDTFVQWFDSQHILYGLNLTSIEDAEGFEREFEVATGKKQRPGTAAEKPLPATQKAQYSVQTQGMAVGSSIKSPVGRSDSAKQETGRPEPRPSVEPRPSLSENKSNSFFEDSKQNDLSNQLGKIQIARIPETSTSSDIKTINQLKDRLKELELVNVELSADKTRLSEQVEAQNKLIAGLNSQVKNLEAELEKAKNNLSQSSTHVQVWKQQMATYQQVNAGLTSKLNDLADVYDKFGEILKRLNGDFLTANLSHHPAFSCSVIHSTWNSPALNRNSDPASSSMRKRNVRSASQSENHVEIEQLDMFPKVEPAIVRSSSKVCALIPFSSILTKGGIFTLGIVLFLLGLVLSEVLDYLAIQHGYEFLVDMQLDSMMEFE